MGASTFTACFLIFKSHNERRLIIENQIVFALLITKQYSACAIVFNLIKNIYNKSGIQVG